MGATTPIRPSGIIFFDGVCNLCDWSVNFVLDHDSSNHFHFASLQSDAAREYIADLDSENLSSVILWEEGKVYQKSDAALRIASHLRFPYRLLSVFKLIPGGLRDYVYDFIATNRYKWFGKKTECKLPTPELKDRFLDS